MRWRALLAAAVAGSWLALPMAAPAQTVEDALKAVPKDAVGFFVVSKLADASTKIAEIAEQLQLPLPGAPLKLLKDKLGLQKGLNDNGAVLVAALADNLEGEPTVLIYVPTESYDDLARELGTKDGEFRDPKGEQMVIAHAGPFAVVTKAEHKQALQKALKGGGHAGKLKGLQAWITNNQASGVLTARGIKLFTAKFQEGLEMGKNFLGAIPDPAAAEMAGNMLEGFSSFAKSVDTDVHAVGAGLRVDKGGNIHLTSRAVFAKDSGFARAAADVQAPEGGPLAGLPDRAFALALGGALPEKCLQSMMRLTTTMLKVALKDDEKAKKLDAAYADLAKGVHGAAVMVGVPREGGSIFGSMIAVMKVDNAPEYLGHQQKALKVQNEVLQGLGQFPQTTVKRIKVDGRPALESVTDMNNVQGADLPPVRAILEAMFGKGGKLTATVVAVDDSTIMTVYEGPAHAKKLLEAVRSKAGLQSQASVAKVSTLLPKESQWRGYVSPNGILELVKRVAENIPGVPPIPTMAKTLPVGFAVRYGATGLEGHLVVPASTLREIAQFSHRVKENR